MKKEQCPLELSKRLIQGLTCIVRYKVGDQVVDRDDAPDLAFRVYHSPIRVPSHYWDYFNSAVGKEIRQLVRLVPYKWQAYSIRDLEIQLHRNVTLKSVGQCPRNLIISACRRCMEAAMKEILKVCPGVDACGVASPSCSLKYSINATW
ncbi:hypothetical protein AXF42_Ash018628 [Apostasia shenzhenica]|uniref:Gnk2-homologous domain-containing protein n=1 Tax=Apostasia shenzhenica TaxID=1088818 RepID=A0A2I0B1H2_9ASPA|nr:hypothetical protein AXF42_Ash018628 [Apostasia shenzhenica]